MKFTLPWLKRFLDTGADAQEIAAALTALGLEVEAVLDRTTALTPFTVARVVEARQHPDADRLRVCDVETKDGPKQIVCGAPNARTGLIGIYAPEGSVIPATGLALKRSTIRGVESQGMLCSARELGVGQDHEGIIELDTPFEVGTPAAAALGIEGPVFDVALTPDRADCFGILGIARDLAAAGIGRFVPPEIEPVSSTGPAGPAIRGDFPPGDENACPMFVGRIIRGVTNGPSPAWMRERLEAIGLRPISALVDITNYVMIEMNRPLHVFDADALEGDLTLRFARPGERLAALDERTYELDESMTVIADEAGPQGLGGIMGGEASGCTETTRNVLLEVALFDPVRTARTGRKLGIDSDARTRFERGLDPAFVMAGVEYGTRLILDLCGGDAGAPVVMGGPPATHPPITFEAAQLPRLAGITLEPQQMETYLRALGFAVEGGPEVWTVTPPSWRHDVSTPACIVEELARLLGYDHIPPVAVTRTEAVNTGVLSAEQRRRGAVRRAVAAAGLAETMTWSFLPEEHARAFGAGEPVRLKNPISSELSVMRPSLLPNLLAAAARNRARKRESGALFELGARYTGGQPGEEVRAVAGVRYGDAVGRGWAQPRRPVDAFDVKADALAALSAAGLKAEALQCRAEPPAWYHPGRAGVLALGPNVLASFGEIHPRIAGLFDLEGPVAAFEIDLDLLPKPKQRSGKSRPPLEQWPYPAVDRDFAFVVDRDVPAEQLLRAVKGAEKKLVRDVEIFDLYEGDRIGAGKKSLAIAVRLQSKERTLDESDIEPIAQKIVAAAAKQCGATLRQ
ncbi:MAG: phenylalanine--tRNA ligase subunit beta [Geminicoccaceae bacterium]|nr:phenylalanine--tRNA ligase subunit beta [Geminicoccaceae bacterium]